MLSPLEKEISEEELAPMQDQEQCIYEGSELELMCASNNHALGSINSKTASGRLDEERCSNKLRNLHHLNDSKPTELRNIEKETCNKEVEFATALDTLHEEVSHLQIKLGTVQNERDRLQYGLDKMLSDLMSAQNQLAIKDLALNEREAEIHGLRQMVNELTRERKDPMNSESLIDLEDLRKGLSERDAEIMRRDAKIEKDKELHQAEVDELRRLMNFFKGNSERLSKEVRDLRAYDSLL